MERLSQSEKWTWLVVAALTISWSMIAAETSLLLFVMALYGYAAYDYYQTKGQVGLTANRFFSLMVIGFVISLTWLDFSTALTALVLVTGSLWIAYRYTYREALKNKGTVSLSAWADVAKNYAPLLLLVWAFRSFIIQPYHVPTGSLEPSLLPHELILVKQFAYGVRTPAWPLSNATLIDYQMPKRGDIALFRSPQNEKVLLIKRVIGLPGDHIRYDQQKLWINGKLSEQIPISDAVSRVIDPVKHAVPQSMSVEKLVGAKEHYIYISTGEHRDGVQSEWVVPEGQYFMMGDNRDNSYDSRFWGFVPEKNLIGKAWLVFMSWDENHHPRWQRLGTRL